MVYSGIIDHVFAQSETIDDIHNKYYQLKACFLISDDQNEIVKEAELDEVLQTLSGARYLGLENVSEGKLVFCISKAKMGK